MADDTEKVTTHRYCAPGVCKPERTEGLITSPENGEFPLVEMRGPGVFLGAEVVKQGGDTGLTFVNLDIDGRNVVSTGFVGTRNWGLTQLNPYGIVLLRGTGDIENMTLGFPVPLRYAHTLRLSVVVDEPGVVQLLANVVHGAT